MMRMRLNERMDEWMVNGERWSKQIHGWVGLSRVGHFAWHVIECMWQYVWLRLSTCQGTHAPPCTIHERSSVNTFVASSNKQGSMSSFVLNNRIRWRCLNGIHSERKWWSTSVKGISCKCTRLNRSKKNNYAEWIWLVRNHELHGGDVI